MTDCPKGHGILRRDGPDAICLYCGYRISFAFGFYGNGYHINAAKQKEVEEIIKALMGLDYLILPPRVSREKSICRG